MGFRFPLKKWILPGLLIEMFYCLAENKKETEEYGNSI